jgi:hypothetical protein
MAFYSQNDGSAYIPGIKAMLSNAGVKDARALEAVAANIAHRTVSTAVTPETLIGNYLKSDDYKAARDQSHIYADELETNPALTEPLSAVENLWRASDYGNRWVSVKEVDAMPRIYWLIMTRLVENQRMEILHVGPNSTTYYRLKEQ